MKKISIVLILLIILLAGCSPNETSANITSQNYAFDNPDTIAYVGGEPVSKASMDNYIIMKKAYMKAIAKDDDRYSDTDMDEMTFSDRVSIKWNIERVNETNSYSGEKDWVNDYYKSIFINQKYKDIFKNDDSPYKMEADEEVKYILDRANNQESNPDAEMHLLPDPNKDIDPDSEPKLDSGIIMENDDDAFDIVSVIQSVADDLEMPFEDCVNNVYRPFFIAEEEYNKLLNIQYDGLNYGEAVEYNDTNDLEYGNYVLNAMEMDRDYLNSLFAEVEIVERP